MLLEALALAGLWAVFFLLRRGTGSSDREANRVFEEWLYWVSAIGVATVSSLAVACAVDATIDGVGIDLRTVSVEVRRRLPALLGWWLISAGVGIGLGFALGSLLQPLPALLSGAVVWGIGTLFVIPSIALQGGGPLGSIGEAFRILRARWGRSLAGLFVIGFMSGLGFLAWGFLLEAIAKGDPGNTAEVLLKVGGVLLIFYLVYALAAATRLGFAVILARDALGDLPGNPSEAKPLRRATVVRRVVFGALALALALIVFGALFVHRRSNTQQTTSQTYVPTAAPPSAPVPSIVTLFGRFRKSEVRDLRPGAPVVLAGKTIGRVSAVQFERAAHATVFFEVNQRVMPIVRRGRKKVATRDGRTHLAVVSG